LPSIWQREGGRRGGGGGGEREVPEKEFPERASPRKAEISAGEHPVGSPPYIGLSLSLSLSRCLSARARFISALLVILVKSGRRTHSGGMTSRPASRRRTAEARNSPGNSLLRRVPRLRCGSRGCAEDVRDANRSSAAADDDDADDAVSVLARPRIHPSVIRQRFRHADERDSDASRGDPATLKATSDLISFYLSLESRDVIEEKKRERASERERASALHLSEFPELSGVEEKRAARRRDRSGFLERSAYLDVIAARFAPRVRLA
jgi:hypothetical protein